MNILAISHEYPPIGGGGSTACRYLTGEFVRSGHSVTVVTSRYKERANDTVSNGVRIIRVNALRKKKDTSSFVEMLSFVFSAFACSDKLCRQESFDVCLVFFGIPSGPIALRLYRKYGIPYVIRFGGGDIPGAQKRFGIVYRLLNPIIRKIWMNAKGLVANSEVLRNRALAFDDTNKIDIICNGVDSSHYSRKSIYKCNEEIKLLFVSRLIEGKGLQFIIPYMKRINERAKRRVTLTIVGDGPYRETLENLVSDENRDFIVFVGRKEGDDLLNMYEEASVFILPSLSEGMPNVVLEAMSMGLPIIMTDCGGSKELINGNGVIAKIDDFVDAIIELCSNNDVMIQYGKESRKRVENFFSWSEKAEEYIRLFDE